MTCPFALCYIVTIDLRNCQVASGLSRIKVYGGMKNAPKGKTFPWSATDMIRTYLVKLSEEERQQLERLIASGTIPARTMMRAYVLLQTDNGQQGPNWTYEQVREAYHVSQVTIAHVRKSYVEGGLEAALYRKPPKREYKRCLDGEGEARLVALACSEPPSGYQRWSLRLLRDRFVRLGFVDTISHETIRAALKKTN